MPKKQLVFLIAVTMLIALVSGCGPMKKQAIFRASMDFDCPEEDLKARAIHPEIFKVKGCGQEASYECSPTSEQCVLSERYEID